MREVEAVIEQIQSMLAWEHDPEQEYMETLVADYTRNVTAANERLRTCEALLSRGLRSEAIQQCETEPNLLDLTAILDFPEVEFWSDYVSQYELPPLPALLLEVAADLNDAYASAQPVAGLLKLHRLHALALSPLSVRIQILRQLASKDKANSLWLEDLASYETARQNQIESDLETVMADKNTTQAVALEAELTSRKWTTRPPADLIRKVQSVRARLQTYDTRKELRHVADALSLAFADRDLDAARHQAERWESLVETAAVREGDAVFEAADAALEWVARENQKVLQEGAYQNSVAALERGLERDSSVEDLNRSAQAITLFDQGIPDELEKRLEERKTQISRKAGRRTLAIIGSIVAVALILCSVLMSWLFGRWHAQSVIEKQQEMRELMTAGQIGAAKKLFSQVQSDLPAVAASPELQQLHGELTDLLEAEASLRSVFLELLVVAENGIHDSKDWDDLDKSLEVLDKAAAAAKGVSEQEEVRRVRDAANKSMAAAQSATDSQFLGDLEAAMTRFRQRPDDDMETNQSLTNEFRAMKGRAHVTESHKHPIDAVLRTLDSARADHQRQAKVSADLQKITEAVGEVGLYKSHLRDYVSSHSGTKRAAAFQSVMAREAKFWDGPQLWNELRDNWKSFSLTDVSPELATRLQKQYVEFVQESNQFPAANDLADQVQALRSVIARAGNKGTRLQERLREPLEFYLRLPLMLAHGESRYYTDEAEPPEETTGKMMSILPFTFKNDLLKRDTEKRVSVGSVTNDRSGNKFVWDAPHAVFAKSALAELTEADQHWEESFGQLVTQLASTEQIDPIVKIKLLYDLLGTGAEGSVFFREAFKTHMIAVDTFEGFEVNWISPTGSGAPSARITATGILNEMSPLDAASTAAIAMRDELAAHGPGPAYRWVGWLYRNSDKTWNCATGPPLQQGDNGALVVVVSQDSKERPSEFARIGSVVSGNVKLDTSGDSLGFVEGRPIYLADEQQR